MLGHRATHKAWPATNSPLCRRDAPPAPPPPRGSPPRPADRPACTAPPSTADLPDCSRGRPGAARWTAKPAGHHTSPSPQHPWWGDRIARLRAPSPARRARLALLLHDAPEYVIGDMISPFKAVIGD